MSATSPTCAIRKAPPGVALRLKLFPQNHEGQKVIDWHVEVDGEEIAHTIVSGYGERFAQWLAQGQRDDLEIVAHGRVETEDRAGIVKGCAARRRPPCSCARRR